MSAYCRASTACPTGCAAVGLRTGPGRQEPAHIVERAARLIEEAGQGAVADRLRKEIGDARDLLDGGLIDQASMPAARVAAAELAYRSAGAVVAATGSTAILAGQHGQRQVREATFLLVAAGRPEIKAGLLATLGKNLLTKFRRHVDPGRVSFDAGARAGQTP